MCKHIDRGKNIVMSETDFRKQLLLNEFKTLSKGKSKEELLPLVFI